VSGSAQRPPIEAQEDQIMASHKMVDASAAPQAPGPFSHATVIGPWVYVSGMGGLDPKTGEVVSDDVIEQTRQSIRNVEAILAAAGCTLQDVVKAVVYLTDMADYPRVNKVYGEAFAPNKPARTCVAVSALPVRERMKFDAVAYREL
jgi:2-iminobutanoate/2-iminopropanoate deaminase